jgi:hypothetical protein
MTLVVRDANGRRLGTVCVTGGKLTGSNPGVHDLVAAAVRRRDGAPAAVRDLANFSNGYITIRNESAPPKALAGDNAAVQLSAQTPVLSTVHHPLGSPAGPGLFRVGGLQLPAYIQNIAHALERNGHPESQAIQLAIGACQRWARGGGKVSPEVRAAAAKALAEWEAAKAAAHSHSNDPEDAVTVELAGAFNSALHPRVSAGATGGGRFAAKNASAAPAAGKQAPAGHGKTGGKGKESPRQQQVRQLREKASALRSQASILDRQAHALALAHPMSLGASATAKKTATTKAKAKKKNLPVKHKTKTSASKKKISAPSVATRITTLQTRAKILRTRAGILDIKAKELALSATGPAVELAVMTPAPERAAGRRKLAAEDKALPDGTDPIPDLDYLKRAIRSVGRLDPSKRPALKALIRKRARELGALNAPGVKGTWAFQAANDGDALELAGPEGYEHGWRFVGVPGSRGLHPGMQVKAHHSVYGDVQATVTKVHKNGNVVATVHHSKLFGTRELTGIALHKKSVTHIRGPVAPPGVAAANDGDAVELAMLAVTPKVRGAADVTMERTAPGRVTVMHKPTGMKVGTLTKGVAGWTAAHSTGRAADPAPTMAASLSGLIGLHNRIAKSVPSMAPAGAKSMANGEQLALDLAGALPYTSAATSSDGPRVTKMATAKTAGKSAPAASSVSAEVRKVYAKLIRRGMKPAQAMALAKRAAAMHARKSPPKASAA